MAILLGDIQHNGLNVTDHPFNTYKPWHRNRVDISHSRILLHFPERFLIVLDSLNSPDEHSYIQWFHFAPDLDLNESDEDVFHCVDGEGVELCSLRTITSNNDSVRAHGQTDPILQGWTGMDGSSLEPSHAVGFRSTGSQLWLGAMLTLGSSRGAETTLTTTDEGFTVEVKSDSDPIKIEYRRLKESILLEVSIGAEQFSEEILISEEM